MKKGFFPTFLIAAILTIFSSCKKDNHQVPGCEFPTNGCFKGRLEIQGMCSNYTIKVLEGNIDPALVVKAWKSPKTGETITNVFALKNSCDFPATIKEGEEFYFQIKNAQEKNCGICAGYYPTPEKGLFIQVVSGPCYTTTK